MHLHTSDCHVTTVPLNVRSRMSDISSATPIPTSWATQILHTFRIPSDEWLGY